MHLFTDNQSAVIKKIWIPVLLAAILSISYLVFVNFGRYDPYLPIGGARMFNNSYGPLIFWLPVILVTYNLEFFLVQHKHRMLIAAVSLVLVAGSLGLPALTNMLGSGYGVVYFTFLIWTALLLLRFVVMGKKDTKAILIALAVAVVLTVQPPARPLASIFIRMFGYGYLMEYDMLYMNMVFPVTYYLFLFIAENLTDSNYIKALRSKLTVMDKHSYLFLFVGLYSLLMPAGRILAEFLSKGSLNNIGYIFRNVFTPLGIIYAVAVLVFVPYLLRNIVVARSLTISNPNKFWFFLHIIPIVNTIAVLFYWSAPAVNTTAGENGTTYMKEPMSVLRYVIIGVALLSILSQASNIARMEDAGVFMGIAVAKLVLLIILIKQEWAVYVMMGLVLLPIFFTRYYDSSTAALALLQCALSIQAFLEVYHPSLEDADAEIYLKEESAIGEDLVVGMD
ncbi:hypothetical protein [Chitinophaga sp. Cy-1792]|uniref:hypothetical protein n=1 Tax=Chitinophaga sp. Cy-1792 TaxID=2608339 RepID=UPI001421C615|nr:hypothetical protein [Chitinophaga sp. Cy-1792]NIG52737.1 hypothetical protein [Chitinophaga sp. Cy-1792]